MENDEAIKIELRVVVRTFNNTGHINYTNKLDDSKSSDDDSSDDDDIDVEAMAKE